MYYKIIIQKGLNSLIKELLQGQARVRHDLCALFALGVLFSASATAQIPEPPNANADGHAQSVNIGMKGQLESENDIGCISLKDAKTTDTPPDLYKGLLSCISQGNYDSAVPLFSLAGVYARFDGERVADKSAAQAREVLIMQTFSKLSEEQKKKFKEALDRTTKNPENMAGLCASIKTIGKPDYFPRYMILHGMGAFMTSDPLTNALAQNFDAESTWKRLQNDYLLCQGPGSKEPPALTSKGSDASSPKHKSTIDLSGEGTGSWIWHVKFSPDGRYLAIVQNPNPFQSQVIVWDLQLNKEQARITGLPAFGVFPGVELQWDPKGKYITFGVGGRDHSAYFWNPMTGEVINQIAVPPTRRARLNRTGTKLLLQIGDGIHHPNFRIYDTANWEFKDYDCDDGLFVYSLAWAADDKIIIGGSVLKTYVGHSLDGLLPALSDSFVRIVDPDGKEASRSIILSHGTPVKGGSDFPFPEQIGAFVVNYATNAVAAIGHKIYVLDGNTLVNYFTYAPSDEDIMSGKMPSSNGLAGVEFSPDGRDIFIKGNALAGRPVVNLILDTKTGATVNTFPGGHSGLAISPDGHSIAIGNGSSVEMLDAK